MSNVNLQKVHINDILELLQVDQENSHYLGRVKSVGSGRLYGGMVMAQALSAAKKSIQDERFQLHSYHCYFLRPGLEKLPVEYRIVNLRNGNFFCNSSVEAYQEARLIFTLSASFHREEEMPSYQTSHMIPERSKDLESWQSIGLRHFKHIPEEAHTFFLRQWPFEIYPIDGDRLFSLKPEKAEQGFWLKLVEKKNLTAQEHKLLFSYISDLMLLQIAGLPTDFKLWERKAVYASVDQCVWFHDHLDVTQWLYFLVESPSYHDARGFVLGKLYNEKGILIATVTQEGLIRSFLM